MKTKNKLHIEKYIIINFYKTEHRIMYLIEAIITEVFFTSLNEYSPMKNTSGMLKSSLF